MTIAELLAATGLTANDLVPIWDAEAAQSVEPTQKTTAAQFAAAVKVLASLVNTTEMNAAIQQSTAWVKAGEATGTNTVSIPATAKEILVYGSFGANAQFGFTWYAIRAHNTFPDKLLAGTYRTDVDHHFAYITCNWNNNTVALGQWIYNVTDYTSTSKIYVYYR